jgi:hypothetical protein
MSGRHDSANARLTSQAHWAARRAGTTGMVKAVVSTEALEEAP